MLLSGVRHAGRLLHGAAWLAVAVLLSALVLSACVDAASATPEKKEIFVLGTYVSVTAYGEQAETGIEAALAEFRDVEARMTRFAGESEISAVNASAGEAPVEVSPGTLEVLRTALAYGEKSGGAFDITVTPLLSAWGFGDEKAGERFRVPAQAEIDAARALVDYRRVEITPDGKVYLPEKGMALDLGGVAKGFAIERAASALREAGVESALINAGGSVKAIGTRPDGKPWRIGIQHPRQADGILGVVPIADGEVVITSGDYQRYFEVDGRRYNHIIDPATGYPATKLMGVSIVGQDALVADCLSTAVFVMGYDEGERLLAEVGGFEMVAMTAEGELRLTAGLAERGEFSS